MRVTFVSSTIFDAESIFPTTHDDAIQHPWANSRAHLEDLSATDLDRIHAC